jgi:hypothetical protein
LSKNSIMHFKFSVDLDDSGWDSGTPYDLAVRLKTLLESDDPWVGGVKLICFEHTPYTDQPDRFRKTLFEE